MSRPLEVVDVRADRKREREGGSAGWTVVDRHHAVVRLGDSTHDRQSQTRALRPPTVQIMAAT